MLEFFDLYKVFAVIDIVSVIRRNIYMKRNLPGTIYYQPYLFMICTILGVLCTLPLMLATEFSNLSMSVLMELPMVHRVMWDALLLIDFCITVVLYIFSGKYATYHIVYYPKKKRRPKVVNVDESHIILHKLLGKQTIQVRDIIPEQSTYYMIDGKESKTIPFSSILGGEEYLMAKLKSGRKIKIQNNMLFLKGVSCEDIVALSELARTLNIEIKYSKN